MRGAAALIFGIVLVAMLAGAMFFFPRQDTARLVASARADEHLQRARRLLLEYDPQLNFESELRAVLGVEDFELAEEPNVEREYQKRLTKNAGFLQAAFGEVNQALGVSVASVSMRQDPAANRLRGMVLSEQGLAISQRVSILRGEEAGLRAALQRRARTLHALRPDVDLVAASAIDARIAEAKAQLAALEQERGTQQQLARTLAERVERLTQELESAREQGDAVRTDMEALEDRGADLTHPGGVAEFARVYRDAADRYRFLVLEAQTIEFGSLENAAADDPATGRYEPIIAEQDIGYRRGLVHYLQDLDAANTTLANLAAAADLARQNVSEMEAMKDALARRASAAEAAIAVEVGAIESSGSGDAPGADGATEEEDTGGELDALLALDAEIRELEDEGLRKFEEAGKSFQAAVTGVAAEMRDVPSPADSARAGKMDDRGRPFHYSFLVKNQRPVQGHIHAQQAEALLRQALLLVGRYQDAEANAGAWQTLGDFFNGKEEVLEWEELAQQTSETAQGLIREAIDHLDKAKDEVGGGNWIIAAEIGSAHYMLGLLGVELAAEKALAWYAIALEDREDQPYAGEHVRMRDYIQRRAEHQ